MRGHVSCSDTWYLFTDSVLAKFTYYFAENAKTLFIQCRLHNNERTVAVSSV
jgi:hypothetical protein